jgi:two-component system chemotaxis response regulator CheY
MAKTVLVIDDSRTTRQFVRDTLTAAGYAVIEAEDGVDALGKLSTEKVHLMVCDVNMPRMDGLTFVGKVKDLAAHRFTPIVMLTTEASGEMVEKGKAAGAKGWMVKPFKPEQLLAVASKLVPL